ncbi:Holliday junction branch migration DNA helicase RuvB [Candidatus Gracilibacteria bacterium]|nr:Holliday junction branch migration DNA helicase RuvB [Candidatus Gracilibacteria bacterium]
MIISNHLQENDQKNKIQSKAQEELADLNAQLKEFENNLRPKNMNAYIGQKKVVRQLKLIIDSANIRSVLPEHIMFYGQPGLGKTTLASLISNELGAHLKTIAAPALQKSGDVVSLLINMEPNTILFIDEIHRLKAPLEEIMYSAMEDKVVDLVMGKGQGVSLGRFDLNDFMIVGATTQLGKVSKPLKDRFPTLFQLEPYDEVDILELLDKNLDVLKIKMTEDARIVLARRCRGVPRIANNILKRFKDLQVVHKIREIDKTTTLEFLDELGVHENGLTKSDILYLKSLKDSSLGLKTLSGILLEEAETLETVVEPYLIHLGYVDKSSDGRRLTPKGKVYVENKL